MKKTIFFLFALTLFACDEENEKTEDLTQDVNKEGSVETQVAVEHLDSQYDILVSTSKIWVKGELHKTIVNRDTLPSLGEVATENDKGENVKIKKDYEFYITVR